MNAYPTMLFGKPKQLGFSLVELMVGVAILAILMGVALPSFQTWTQDTKVRNAAESIKDGMMQARTFAITRNANFEFALIGNNSAWQVCLSPCASNVPEFSRLGSEGSKGVTTVSASSTLGAASIVTFNFVGSVTNNFGGSGQLAQVDVTAPGNSRNLRVTVGTLTNPPAGPYTGSVPKMCDPNLSAPVSTRC